MIMTLYTRKDNGMLHVFGSYELVPVPSHGRLIDYDSVMERYSKWFRNTENREYENMFYMLQNELRGAPTIVPAEGS